MTPTHLRTRDNGRMPPQECELVCVDGPLASVKVLEGAYWEQPREITISVLVSELTPLTAI